MSDLLVVAGGCCEACGVIEEALVEDPFGVVRVYLGPDGGWECGHCWLAPGPCPHVAAALDAAGQDTP